MIYSSELPDPFQLELPEIYQIEVSSKCNFNCTMCPRKKFTRKDTTPFISTSLIRKMIREGDFNGSYFVELQMSGEPLLHPNLDEVVDLVKSTGVTIGLSTNGFLINSCLSSLAKLDYITVSLDSITGYEKIRKGGDIDFLIDSIFLLTESCKNTVVDLQLIELPGWEEQYRIAEELFSSLINSKKIKLRTVKDCFLTYFNEVDTLPVKDQLCLNPWLSVSVQSNGNVTACCFSFGDDILLGNLNESSLRGIWEGEEIKKLRYEHSTKSYRPICSKCYMRSPVLLHWDIFTSSFGGR